MAGKFHHEAIYRGADRLAKLAAVPVTVCGAGALGSHLADNLARQGFTQLRVIDRDRVEEHNVGTQLYGESEVGVSTTSFSSGSVGPTITTLPRNAPLGNRPRATSTSE